VARRSARLFAASRGLTFSLLAELVSERADESVQKMGMSEGVGSLVLAGVMYKTPYLNRKSMVCTLHINYVPNIPCSVQMSLITVSNVQMYITTQSTSGLTDLARSRSARDEGTNGPEGPPGSASHEPSGPGGLAGRA
jgi:hypothetical protein